MKTYRKILIALLMAICAISCAFAVACTNTEEPPENKPQRLNAPKNLAIAINDEYEYEVYVLTWDSVENASEYKVLIDDQEFTVTECSFDLDFLTEPDTYNIYVCAVGDGTNYTNSIHAKITHTVLPLEQLAMPQNLKIEYGVLVWDSVKNASEYKVLIDEQEFTVTECSFDLGFLTELDTYNIYVCAIGDGTNYTNSIHAKITHSVKEEVVNIEYELFRTGEFYSVSWVDPTTRGVVKIPNEHNGLPVERIKTNAFKNCIYVTEVILPENVNLIQQGAFINSTSLTKINLKNVVEIYGSSFDNTGIYNDEANWKNGILYIDGWLITAKTEISGACNILQGTRSIANSALYKQSGISEIIIPNSVTYIGQNAFSYCSSITKITIPNSVTYLGKSAFSHCLSITKITIPDSVTTLPSTLFYGCSSLEYVDLPKTITYIDMSVFTDCTSLKAINFNGTFIEWQAIKKYNSWANDAPDFIIYCTDGELDKLGNVVE